jgi:hypothetical protein
VKVNLVTETAGGADKWIGEHNRHSGDSMDDVLGTVRAAGTSGLLLGTVCAAGIMVYWWTAAWHSVCCWYYGVLVDCCLAQCVLLLLPLDTVGCTTSKVA